MDGGLNQTARHSLDPKWLRSNCALSTMLHETKLLLIPPLPSTRYRMTIHHFIITPHSVAPDTPTHPTLHPLMKTWMDSFSHVADVTVVVGRVQSRLFTPASDLGRNDDDRVQVLDGRAILTPFQYRGRDPPRRGVAHPFRAHGAGVSLSPSCRVRAARGQCRSTSC